MIGALLIAAVVVARAPYALAAETPDQLRELVRKSAAGLQQESERREQYLFKVRNERKELDNSEKVTSWHVRTWERIEIDGFTFSRTLERDGKPLAAEERRIEEAAIQKQLAELRAPPAAIAGAGGVVVQPATLRKRPAAQSQDEWFREIPNALNFKLMGEEIINGRPALKLDATPQPGYQAKNMRARVFEKLKATLWIDKATSELVKADAEMFDTVSVGFGVLGRIEKGTRFRMQRRLVADGDWLIESQSVRFAARLLLFKTMHSESTTEWSEFRRRPAVAIAASPAAIELKSRP